MAERKRKPAGRPSQLREVQEQIVGHVRDGAYLTDAAQAADIGPRTAYRWLARGREVDAIVAEHDGDPKPAGLTPHDLDQRAFWQAVTRARAERRAEAMAAIRVAAKSDYRAATWYMERHGSGRYGSGGVNAERATNLFATALARCADDPRLGLDAAQRAALGEVVRDHLDALADLDTADALDA